MFIKTNDTDSKDSIIYSWIPNLQMLYTNMLRFSMLVQEVCFGSVFRVLKITIKSFYHLAWSYIYVAVCHKCPQFLKKNLSQNILISPTTLSDDTWNMKKKMFRFLSSMKRAEKGNFAEVLQWEAMILSNI